MQHLYPFNAVVLAGLLLAAVLWPAPTAADPYSGLANPTVDTHRGAGVPLRADPSGYVFGPSPVPATPQAPVPTTRPAGWPGQMPQYPTTGCAPMPWTQGLQSSQGPTRNTIPPTGRIMGDTQSQAAEAKRCEDARLVARVGPEVILAGDVMAIFVNDNLAKLTEPVPEEFREKLLKALVPRAVVMKLMYLEAKRAIPEENLLHVEEQIKEYFYRKTIPKMMKQAKVSSLDELKQRLVSLGSSIQWQERLFVERALGQQWMATEVKTDEAVSPEAMLRYYRDHISDYEHTAKARWEELMVSFSKTSGQQAAYGRLAQLGNQVKNGLPFAEAARRGSDGPTAAEGGARDWTTQSSLVSEQLDRALFGLPVGQLSPILKSKVGLHIIRVVERTETHWTPFTEVQDEIRKAMQEDRWQGQSQAYLARLTKKTPVWTAYDKAAAVAARNPRNPDDAPRSRY